MSNEDDALMTQALYDQVCRQHDGISDFRAKLLALLPIASGAGIFLLLQKDGLEQLLSPHSLVIGLFGIAVTTGLFFYELRGIQKCIALIGAARELEQGLSRQFEGAFRCKPDSVWGISAETSALIIYPSVIGSWTYVFTLGLPKGLGIDWLNHHPSALALVRATIAVGVAGLCAFMAARMLKRGSRSWYLETIRNLNRQSFLAEELGDTAMLEPILDDEFWIVRSGGERQNKKQMLDALASTAGGRRVIRKELVQPCGSTVVALTLIGYYKGRELVGDFWNSKVFVRDDRGWRCKAWQVFRVL
jgi:Domain of unknown function (DUF4440)